MKILLNMLSTELKGVWGFIEHHQLRPAMGLLILASVLREAGHEVELADQRAQRFRLDQWIDKIKRNRYDLVGVTTYSTTRPHHASYIRALRKQYNGIIAVGGPDLMKSTADFWLEQGADVAVIGEGERTVVELLDRLKNGLDISGIPGIVVRDSQNNTVWGSPRPLMDVPELEQLPYPDWNSYWIESYEDATVITSRRPGAAIVMTRGCPYRCSYCSSPKLWKTVRQRSVKNVIGEIDWLVENFGIRYLGIYDDVFGLTTEWTLDFCDAMKSRAYDLTWMICLHPLVFGSSRLKVYRAMADAGLRFISFGAQSANADVLRNINRRPEEIDVLRENIRLCREMNIATALSYIFGLPGDSPQTVEEAIRFVSEVRPTLAEFHPLFYLEGTKLWEQYPNCDANPYGLEVHRRWSSSARRKFYLNPVHIYRLLSYILRYNPRYTFKLLRIIFNVLPQYIFERSTAEKWESGDRRTF